MSRVRKGFTLIELLVVIAIIALLIAILLPALSAAKQEGLKAKCVTNLRAIGQVAATYATDDANGVLGPVHQNAALFTGEGYADYGGGPGTMPFTGWNQQFDPRTRPFNHVIYGKGGVSSSTPPGDRSGFQVFQCPGEELGWQNWPGFGANPLETENSYFKANGTAFRMNNLAFTDGYTLGIYGRPINRIPKTSETLAFMESRVYETIWTNDQWGSLQDGELTGYHGKLGYFTVVYADSHAGFPDFGDGTFYPHLQFSPLGHPDVRGTWGRMDCLPELMYDPGL